MMRNKMVWALLTWLISCSSFAFASTSHSQSVTNNEAIVRPAGMPETISLLETTPLYSEPDDTSEPRAALSPQDVKVVGTQYGGDAYADPFYSTWIQIRTTWLGDMWVKVNNTKLGVIRPFDAELQLAAETPLYDQPYRGSANGASLSPQTVHAKAEFISPSGVYAIQIETDWRGDQWLISPEINNGLPEPLSFPDAVSPDYGALMSIRDLQIVRTEGRKFVQGRLVLQDRAWDLGRIKIKPDAIYYVSGKLIFWDASGEAIAQNPYAVEAAGGHSANIPLLLPVDHDLSSAVAASLQKTFPYYFGLPVPPMLNLSDPDGNVSLGIDRRQNTGGFTIANGWISGKIPGSHDYRVTLTFFDAYDRLLGTAHVHQRLNGPAASDQANREGEVLRIDIVGEGDWTAYDRVMIHVDEISE